MPDDDWITDEMRLIARNEIASFVAFAVYSPINVAEAVLTKVAPLVAHRTRTRCMRVIDDYADHHDGCNEKQPSCSCGLRDALRSLKEE